MKWSFFTWVDAGALNFTNTLGLKPEVQSLGEVNRLFKKGFFKKSDSIENKLKKIVRRSKREFTVFEIKGVFDIHLLKCGTLINNVSDFDRNMNDYIEICNALKDLNVRPVFLYRSNYLKMIVSLKSALERKKNGMPGWIVKDENKLNSIRKLKINPYSPFSESGGNSILI
jgi:hypothetical protein